MLMLGSKQCGCCEGTRPTIVSGKRDFTLELLDVMIGFGRWIEFWLDRDLLNIGNFSHFTLDDSWWFLNGEGFSLETPLEKPF